MREVPAQLGAKLAASAGRLPDMTDLRMDDIARASGIPRATLYYYFAGKDDVLAFLLDACLEGLAQRVAAVIAAADDVRTRLRNVLAVVLELPVTMPELSHLLLLNLSKIGKLADLSASYDAAVIAPLRQLLEEGVRRGELAPLTVPVAAMAIFGAASISGLGSSLRLPNRGSDHLADDILDLVWNGIGRP